MVHREQRASPPPSVFVQVFKDQNANSRPCDDRSDFSLAAFGALPLLVLSGAGSFEIAPVRGFLARVEIGGGRTLVGFLGDFGATARGWMVSVSMCFSLEDLQSRLHTWTGIRRLHSRRDRNDEGAEKREQFQDKRKENRWGGPCVMEVWSLERLRGSTCRIVYPKYTSSRANHQAPY